MKNLSIILIAILIAVMITNCTANQKSSEIVPQQNKSEIGTSDELLQTPIDDTYVKQDAIGVIYLAGGCFWGMEKLMQSIPGVVSATNGYANGEPGEVPTYQSVSSGRTGYRETVRVEYDTKKVSLDAILFAYFHVIDPTIENAQGNDYGSQYQTGVYYTDEASRVVVERIAEIEKERHDKFVVEIEPLQRFYDAEDFHQDYLDKNPSGYCHISQDEFDQVSKMIIDPTNYQRPAAEMIKGMLTEEQFQITQEAGTEIPFQNEYWDHYDQGIYVDVVTGEPLFSSSDKYESASGWPSFSKGIDINTFVFIEDNSFGMVRTEVRSRTGNSHLGHVFYGDSKSPSGIRYCINSGALRFIPFEEMEAEGYGYLKEYVE